MTEIPEGWTGEEEYEYQRYLVAVRERELGRERYTAPTPAEYDAMLQQDNAMRAELDRRIKLIDASPTEWQQALPIITNPEDVFGI